MTVRNLLLVNAVLSLVSAAGLLLVPEQFVAPFGVELSPPGVMLGRMYGSVLLGLAVMSWLGRDLAPDGRRVLVIGSAVGWVGFTVAMALAVTGAVANGTAVLWIVIGLAMALAALGAMAGVGVREEGRI